MFSKIFSKKNDDDDYMPEISPRPRFRRTRSAASESVYADYCASLLAFPLHSLISSHELLHPIKYQTTGATHLQFSMTDTVKKSSPVLPRPNSKTGSAQIRADCSHV